MKNKSRTTPAAILPDSWQGWQISADHITDPDGNVFSRNDLRAVWLSWQQLSAYRQQSSQLHRIIAALMASRPKCSRPWPRQRLQQRDTREPRQLALIPNTRPQKTRP